MYRRRRRRRDRNPNEYSYLFINYNSNNNLSNIICFNIIMYNVCDTTGRFFVAFNVVFCNGNVKKVVLWTSGITSFFLTYVVHVVVSVVVNKRSHCYCYDVFTRSCAGPKSKFCILVKYATFATFGWSSMKPTFYFISRSNFLGKLFSSIPKIPVISITIHL